MGVNMIYYARSKNEQGEKETIKHHLKRTSELCGEYTSQFVSKEIGEYMGLFHDFGKYSEKFQNVLEGKEHNIDHAFAGAAFLMATLFPKQKEKSPFWPLYVCIRAHHGELDYHCQTEFLDWCRGEKISPEGKNYSITKEQIKQSIQLFKSDIKLPEKIELPVLKTSIDKTQKIICKMFFTRMLFSSLVDADYSASAEHFDIDYLKKASIEEFSPAHILNRLQDFRNHIIKSSNSNDELNEIRNQVFDCCTKAGKIFESGIYTLTAPTGSGKTLAMLEFGLQQMINKNKTRLIFVLPYLSIIEQNAAIYEKIIPNILQDHSQTERSEKISREIASRWDSQVILTTSVKFFESLFASKGSACRKLHNIANSVNLFDEAQSLPAKLAAPTLNTLKELSENYNSVVVFSTATQPDFNQIPEVNWLPNEIIDNKYLLFDKSRRVNTIWKLQNQTDLLEIAQDMLSEEQACIIVNLRSHAKKIYNELKKYTNSVYLLTTDLCPMHRTQVLNEIKKRLNNKEQCFLVATQCIEAGVDISFPVLYRSLAPLESIIQAAGRCNRNDTTIKGKFVVFIPDENKLYPEKFYQQSANAVLTLSSRHEIDIYNLEHINEYYQILFTDVKGKETLNKAIMNIDFHSIAKEYKLIEDNQIHVLVPFTEQEDIFINLAEQGRKNGVTLDWINKATPLAVNTYDEQQVKDNCEELYVRIGKEKLKSGWYVLNNRQFYDIKKGLDFSADFDCII